MEYGKTVSRMLCSFCMVCIAWLVGRGVHTHFVRATLASGLKRILARVQIDSMGKWSGLVSCSQEVMRKELVWGEIVLLSFHNSVQFHKFTGLRIQLTLRSIKAVMLNANIEIFESARQ